jgi:ATP-dependent Clp protease ATP-binding subunit ClpC
LQKYIEDPLSEALIQGILPRPSELDIYLGETGIYYRLANTAEPAPVIACEIEGEVEAPASPGIMLYTF